MDPIRPEPGGPPRPLLAALEWPRALAEGATLLPSLPFLALAPRGDGHPVLVLPGLLGGDGSTRAIRDYLNQRGYRAHRWRLGRNRGLHDGIGGRLGQRLASLHRRYGRKVSLVGWSLGGLYARELAKAAPEQVRQVVTLGSPFGGERRGHRVGWLHRAVFGEEIDPEARHWLNSIAPPPPVPSTAIYSRSDGIAGWQACMETVGSQVDNIRVRGSHIGLGVNAVVLYAIADRLALPEDGWLPFDRSGWRSLLYS